MNSDPQTKHYFTGIKIDANIDPPGDVIFFPSTVGHLQLLLKVWGSNMRNEFTSKCLCVKRCVFKVESL